MTGTTPTPYRHTQIGWLMIYIFSGLSAGALVLSIVLLSSLRWPDVVPVMIAPFSILGISAICLPLFYKLTTVVDANALEARFGIGLIRYRFPLQDIASAQPVRNSWYHGWGIHWVGSGWVYNVSGWEAVEIKMRNGRRHRIGTDEPEQLAAAIQQGIS